MQAGAVRATVRGSGKENHGFAFSGSLKRRKIDHVSEKQSLGGRMEDVSMLPHDVPSSPYERAFHKTTGVESVEEPLQIRSVSSYYELEFV